MRYKFVFVGILCITLLNVLFTGSIVQAWNTYSVDFESDDIEYLSVGDSASLSVVGNFTAETWVKLELASDVGDTRVILSKDNDQDRGWVMQYMNDGVYANPGIGVSLSSEGDGHPYTEARWAVDLGSNVWHHVAIAVTPSVPLPNKIKLYIDGIDQGAPEYSDEGGGGALLIADNAAPFRIGLYDQNGPVGPFDGLMDEVRVWNVARTEEEIAADMSRELVGNEPGLVAYWKFNGESLEDATANNNDLTNVNGATFSTDTPFTGEQEINPVIIIPGILGSAQQHGAWVIDPILHTYDDLVSTLDENGYTPDVDLFTFGYDWRNSNVATAEALKEKIDEVKEVCACAKVDLVAHSMGGLVARQYIQSAAYADDVDQLIFLGTPHRGAPKAYAMWEGGAFVTPSVFDRLTQRFLKGDARLHGYSSTFAYLREHPVTSVQELLPDYDYLFDAGVLRGYPSQYPANPFLESLNSGVQSLLDAGSELYAFVGNDAQTITGLDVVAAPAKAPLWEHGYPENFDMTNTDRGLVLGVGDQTVPLTSASFINEHLTAMDAVHNALPEEAAGEVVEILHGEPAATVVNEWNVPNIKVLMFQMFSPANLLITDPSGKKIGTTANGVDVNELPGAFYAGPTEEREIITIPNPVPGIYTVEVRGVSSGEYTVESSFLANENEDSVARSGMTAAGRSTVYKVNLAENAADTLKLRATIKGMIADLEYAYGRKWMDASAYYSLKAKLNSAQLLEGKSVIGQRVILQNVKKELDQRRGRSVKQEAYDVLIEDINSLL